MPLATTPGGKNFALKALHPSEHTIRSARIPGGNLPSVAITCDMVQTYPIDQEGAVMYIGMTPHLMAPASLVVFNRDSSVVGGTFYNAAFGGRFVFNPTPENTKQVMSNIYSRVSKYRVTSQSITVELIAPALSDQGTITACQYESPPATFNTSGASSTVFDVRPDVHVYEIWPDQSELLLGTNAYTAKAREGCYMPLKLSSFKWVNCNDLMVPMTLPSLDFDIGTWYKTLQRTTPLYVPYYESRTGVENINGLPEIPKVCGHNFGIVCVRGTATGVNIRIRVRQVVEIVAPPSTVYSPMLEAPLPPDEYALKMYKEVSGRMKDAYPASYNDLGTLLNVVTKIADKMSPFVDPILSAVAESDIPVIGTAAKAIKGGKKVIQKIIHGDSTKKSEPSPSKKEEKSSTKKRKSK